MPIASLVVHLRSNKKNREKVLFLTFDMVLSQVFFFFWFFFSGREDPLSQQHHHIILIKKEGRPHDSREQRQRLRTISRPTVDEVVEAAASAMLLWHYGQILQNTARKMFVWELFEQRTTSTIEDDFEADGRRSRGGRGLRYAAVTLWPDFAKYCPESVFVLFLTEEAYSRWSTKSWRPRRPLCCCDTMARFWKILSRW